MTSAPDPSALLALLDLEREARDAGSADALRFVIVNRTRALVSYRQAALMQWHGGRPRLIAVSDVAVLDRNAPYVRWLERVARRIAGGAAGADLHAVDATVLPERDRAEWSEWSAPHVLWVPVRRPGGAVQGVLWLARDTPWSETDRVVPERLAATYAHAWRALAARPWRGGGAGRGRVLTAAAAVALIAALWVPVPQSALAPAEVVAREPVVVAAPLDGVVARFHVQPNQAVEAGQPLLSFEDATLRNQAEVADEERQVAEAELRTATQGAFTDPHGRAQVALLQARVDLSRAEQAWARELLDKVTVTAERAGIAVFRDVDDWMGRPVKTGEKILVLADPAAVELRIDLPVAEAMVLAAGAPVRLFLDIDPLAPVAAMLEHASYEAEMSAGEVLSYRVTARFADDVAPPRIGLRGTAKVSGADVPLYLYLFRRPIAAARQALGL